GGWVHQEAEALIRRGETDSPAEFGRAVAGFASRLMESARQSRAQWVQEKEAFVRLVGELATQLEEMRQTTGGMGRRLSESINRIKTSETVEELQQLRILLVREAEDLKRGTQVLQSRLVESQQQLVQARHRVRELSEELEKSRTESMTDALTGVANRRAFEQTLHREHARSVRHKLPLSLVMFDLDHFKKVNDTYGHPVGDKVLTTVAERAGKMLRQSDLIARYGGEEFVLILPEATLEAAAAAAEKIRLEVMRLRFKTGNQMLTVTSSFGVCEWQPGMTPEELLHQADQALYRAKQGGRNRVVSCLEAG
ncbi:MAG: diguanylate cyclase, partial [Magnetococcales bacterium]|nr:diguanylate cyclase [Magnetococcales bacterium]